MGEATKLERLLRRERALTAAGLILLCLLSWGYILSGGGLRAEPQAMGMSGMPMAANPAAWPLRTWLITTAMWWTMMAAMMLASATPTILLYAGVRRHAAGNGERARVTSSSVFAAGYLLAWLAFSVAATALQWALQQTGLVSPAVMASRNRWLSGAVLIAAGLYQLSPAKDLCLRRCRSPAAFLARHWRPGAAGAVRLGLLHGGYCVGCCWLLMALLFVGGVMNLAWIAGLTALVLAEKLVPGGRWVARAAGASLIAWGLASVAD